VSALVRLAPDPLALRPLVARPTTLWLFFLLAVCATGNLRSQCPDGTPPPCGHPAVGAPPGNSVAVLLFANVTGDSSDAYLSDGLASEIATSLARVPRLAVTSPGVVRSAQRGGDADPRRLGRRLGVRYVVEGDYQRGGGRIRISVNLVAVAAGTQQWAESYTRPAADLLAVQEDIAGAVATAIAGRLLPAERTVLTSRPTSKPEAYDHVLRGDHELARRTPEGVARAIDEYAAAVRLDSTFARADARIALGYALYLDWGWDYQELGADSLVARGTRAVDRALALDSTSADAWMVRGYLLAFVHPRTLEGVLPALERATRLDPRNAEAWHQYSSWLFNVDPARALAPASRALQLEPGRAITHFLVGNTYEVLRRDRDAALSYDSAIAANPEFYAAYASRAYLRLRLGDTVGARADAEAALRTGPPSEQYYGLGAAAAVAAAGGDSAAARDLTARAAAVAGGRRGPFVAGTLAEAFVAAGQRERALRVLEEATPRGAALWNFMLWPELAPLRADPRFQRLLAESRPPGAMEP
jgi:adenylate cyclase